MKNFVVSFLLLLAALSGTGCGSLLYKPLPVSAAEAPSTFAPLTAAATELGYQAYQHPDRVIVAMNEYTSIYYSFDASHNFVMWVQVDDDRTPQGPDVALYGGQQVGDQIWNRAMELRRQTMAPTYAAPAAYAQPVYVQPAPGPNVQVQATVPGISASIEVNAN